MEKDSLTTTPSSDSKSPVNTESSKKKKKSHDKSDKENNEKTPVKENSRKSKDNSESPLATKLPQEEDVMYLKIDKALLSRLDIAKLLMKSENADELANTSVNVGQNTSTSSISKDIFIPPQHPSGLAAAAPVPPMQSQTAPVAPVMPVQYQQGYFMQPAQQQSASMQSLQSVPFVAEEEEVM